MLIQPYLIFGGRCEEAVGFYRAVLGAEVEMLMRFKDAPQAPPPGMIAADWDNRVMHVAMKIGDSVVMASDGGGLEKTAFQGFSLSLTVGSIPEAEQKFAALAQGGKATMPLGKTFWSPCFGMLVDRFGVSWMVIVPA